MQSLLKNLAFIGARIAIGAVTGMPAPARSVSPCGPVVHDFALAAPGTPGVDLFCLSGGAPVLRNRTALQADAGVMVLPGEATDCADITRADRFLPFVEICRDAVGRR